MPRLIIEFEQADLRNDIEWFDKYYEINKIQLNKHFQMTNGVFDWKNFKDCKKKRFITNNT